MLITEKELEVNTKVIENEPLTYEELEVRNKYLERQIQLIVKEVDLFWQDKPSDNGLYLHTIYCNGRPTMPPAHNDKRLICNCKNTPFVKRIKRQAIEEYEDKLIDEGFPFV